MRRLLLAAAILPILGQAGVAAPNDRAEWNPPARYDHPYSGDLTVIKRPQKEVIVLCRELFKKYDIPAKSNFRQRGCSAITSPTSCTVIMIDRPFRSTKPDAVRRHEVGHCNKWPSSHPD